MLIFGDLGSSRGLWVLVWWGFWVGFGLFWGESGGLKMPCFWGFWGGGRGVLRKWGFLGFSGV